MLITDEERAIGRMAIELSGSINATLCTLKDMMPREFEEALVVFLKHGTGEDMV